MFQQLSNSEYARAVSLFTSLFIGSPKYTEQVPEETPHLPREALVHLSLHTADIRRLQQGLTVLGLGQNPLLPQESQQHVGAFQHPIQMPVRVVDLLWTGEHGGEEGAFPGGECAGRLVEIVVCAMAD